MEDSQLKFVIGCINMYNRLLQRELSTDKLRDRVYDVAQRYVDMDAHLHEATGVDVGYGWPHAQIACCGRFYIEDDSIRIVWSETWSYGGHDHGEFSFPCAFVYDEEVFQRHLKEKQDEIDRVLRMIAETSTQLEFKAYERLKEKFGQ